MESRIGQTKKGDKPVSRVLFDASTGQAGRNVAAVICLGSEIAPGTQATYPQASGEQPCLLLGLAPGEVCHAPSRYPAGR